MNISGLLIRVVILLIPGLLSFKLYKKLRGRISRKDWEDWSEVLIFSMLTYLLTGLLFTMTHSIINHLGQSWNLSFWGSLLCNTQNATQSFTIFQALTDEKIPIPWNEILTASFIGVLLAFCASFVYRYKLINKTGKVFRVTNRYGDEDVWDFFHNMPNLEWVFVRDHMRDLVYFGWIQAFSESGEEREILLGDVDVYSNIDGNLLYKVKALYVAADKHQLSIEVPELENDEEKSNEQEKNS